MYYGKKVVLRHLELDDVDHFMETWNDLELRRTLSTILPASRQQEEDFVRSSWEKMKKRQGYVFAITTYDGTFIGSTGFHDVDHVNQTAEMGIAIHRKENQGKGYGTDAVITLCALGFKHLNFNRVQLEYFDFNDKGARAYEKAGFSPIGTRRQAFYRDNKFIDLHLMDILRDEWFEKFGDEYTLYKPE